MKLMVPHFSNGMQTKRPNTFWICFILAGLTLLAFIILPVLAILLGTGMDILIQTLNDAEVIKSLILTFYAALISTAITFLCGVPMAYILARVDFIGKPWIEGLINLPIVIPHTAAGIALLLVFGRFAPLGIFFEKLGCGFVDQLPGIVVGMTFVSLPFLVRGSKEAFSLIDPELERVAETEGASKWQVFFLISLPLAWRGVAAGALMMWGRAISEFGAVIIIAYHPKIIPVLVYERFAGFGLARAQPVAVILILASLVVFVLVQVLLRFREQKH